VEYRFSVLGLSVEFRRLWPTVWVSNADVLLSVLTPAAIGLGISVERGKFIPAATVSGINWENGGLDDVVESCVIISVFIF